MRAMSPLGFTLQVIWKENMENIEQRHRILAASKISGQSLKDGEARMRIITGRNDEHPLVQAAAFYDRACSIKEK